MDIAGRHLTPDEALQVAKIRCEEIKLDVVKFHHNDSIRRQSEIKVDFLCKGCGEITKNRRYDNIYRGTNKPYCRKCTNSMKGDKSRFMTREELQLEVNELYKSKQFSFKVLNNPPHFHNTSNVELKCLNCGLEQDATVRYLKTGRKSCKCANTGSNLEYMVRIVLITLGVEFEPEYVFDDIEGELPPRYDFAVKTDSGIKLIECDGIQHFEPTFGEESFKITQRTDDVKDEYALKNNIPLLRISYKETEQESIQKTIEFIKS